MYKSMFVRGSGERWRVGKVVRSLSKVKIKRERTRSWVLSQNEAVLGDSMLEGREILKGSGIKESLHMFFLSVL